MTGTDDMSSLIKHMLIYGGSFDPPHIGHLNTAINVQKQFHFDKFIFLPCKIPVLKQATSAGTLDRVNMLKLMLQDNPEFSISTQEIERSTPSYMSETLRCFRQKLGAEISITLLLGADAFCNFNQWHHWTKIPTLCNLLIIMRPGIKPANWPEPLSALLLQHQCMDPLDLLQSPFGKIAYVDAGQYPISSTDLRHTLKNINNKTNYLTKTVYDYIQKHQLYL